MNLTKDLDRLVQGVTSSSSKKKVIKQRVEDLLIRVKKAWYGKLIEKLQSIKNGDYDIDTYIEEVKSKI
jgi:hypothetical protein